MDTSSRDASAQMLQQSAGFQSYGAGGYQVASVVGTPQNSPSYEMIPHRVFVGGFQAGTTEQELRQFFEQYGEVREVKVIRNNEGSSKGYGFVTFDTEEEASTVRKLTPEKLEFKGRRLNLGPAMRRISHGSRFAEFAVASPQAVYAGGGAFAYPSVIIPEGYAVAQPQPTYLVVPPTTPGYQYLSPSFAYSPATPNQQRSFVLPPTPNPTPAVPYSVQAPAYGQQAQKTPSPAKTPRSTGVAKTPTRESKTPTRHGVLGTNGTGSASGSPATTRRAQLSTSPHRQEQAVAPQTTLPQQAPIHQVQSQTNVLTAAQLGPAGDPMTPVTPGMVNGQQASFRWPHNAVQQMPTTPLHPGQYYQPATMMSTYQPTADMTHYSQMYPPAQMYQQQDCFTTEIMAAANVEATYERQALKSAFDAMKI